MAMNLPACLISLPAARFTHAGEQTTRRGLQSLARLRARFLLAARLVLLFDVILWNFVKSSSLLLLLLLLLHSLSQPLINYHERSAAAAAQKKRRLCEVWQQLGEKCVRHMWSCMRARARAFKFASGRGLPPRRRRRQVSG